MDPVGGGLSGDDFYVLLLIATLAIAVCVSAAILYEYLTNNGER